ncbi:helix-turn-helix domain-containing protein [Actinokineospora pegani]|uniref:helix-turn-helix domain-containing protein n=1 Tax=Actinokineospora pegani TaxID=2654637 RepID=UPI0012EA4785|nr:helix-turn-helix domain-containing protein [Actinokineospora pegani]
MPYAERRPSRDSGAGVACVWTRFGDTTPTRVLPDACADVIWHRETGELWLAGPDTTAKLSSPLPGTLVAIRYPSLRPAFGIPACDLVDARVPLADLHPRAGELADRLAQTTTTADAQRVLTSALPAPADPLATELRRLATTTGDVRGMADRLNRSPRQLRRDCQAAFGYGPRMLHRVLRFSAAVSQARTGTHFGAIAADLGYADQPHLAKDVREFAGVSLSTLVGRGNLPVPRQIPE